jgi:hypothetical protein
MARPRLGRSGEGIKYYKVEKLGTFCFCVINKIKSNSSEFGLDGDGAEVGKEEKGLEETGEEHGHVDELRSK